MNTQMTQLNLKLLSSHDNERLVYNSLFPKRTRGRFPRLRQTPLLFCACIKKDGRAG